jgi:quercetin dioxygenase-like cupin family protein
MMKFSLAVGMICLATAALADDAKPAAKKAAKAPVAMSASDLKWVEVPNSGGVKSTVLWGDMATGAHGAMAKFPAGSKHPLHTHSNNIKVVVVSGTFTFGADEASSKEFGPGSYVMVPGKMKHVSGCTPAAECLLFQESPGKFDMKPVK